MTDILDILDSYPRRRPALSAAHRVCYVEEYTRNRQGQGVIGAAVCKLESRMHREIAKVPGGTFSLELGAGTLNHLPYESTAGRYDVVEPFKDLWEGSPCRSQIDRFYNDVFEIEEGQSYDRILSVAVLEHLTELPWIVARSALLLSPGGVFLAGIPSEGKMLWGIGWRLTTAIAYRLRTGLDYGAIMSYEHINTAEEVVAVTRFFFEHVRLTRFPGRWSHLSFYTIIQAASPKSEVAACFLAQRKYIPSEPPHQCALV